MPRSKTEPDGEPRVETKLVLPQSLDRRIRAEAKAAHRSKPEFIRLMLEKGAVEIPVYLHMDEDAYRPAGQALEEISAWMQEICNAAREQGIEPELLRQMQGEMMEKLMKIAMEMNRIGGEEIGRFKTYLDQAEELRKLLKLSDLSA